MNALLYKSFLNYLVIFFSKYTTSYIYNLHRIMALPLGTGTYFYYNNIQYIVLDMNYNKNNDYFGISGSIVHKNSNGHIWVKTIDSVIQIKSLIIDGKKVVPGDIFKINTRFI